MSDKQPGSGILREIGRKALAEQRDQERRRAEAEAMRRVNVRHTVLHDGLQAIVGANWPYYRDQLKDQLGKGQPRVVFDNTVFEVQEPAEGKRHAIIATASCPTCGEPIEGEVGNQADLGAFYEQYDAHVRGCVAPAAREMAELVQAGRA